MFLDLIELLSRTIIIMNIAVSYSYTTIYGRRYGVFPEIGLGMYVVDRVQN